MQKIIENFDNNKNYLNLQKCSELISTIFHITPEQISDIIMLKKGMTNDSFIFSIHGNKYIIRMPGKGTEQLINRVHEANVYKAISGLGLCDDPVYINPQNGYKISKFLEGIQVCNSNDVFDLKRCMNKLRKFHAFHLTVEHTFDIFAQIEYYETLRKSQPSIYKDYEQTKENVLSLKPFIDSLDKDFCLTHIDAVPDNFLFYRPEGKESELLQLTDWEYSGMQDPHVDIAMFCIYSLYNKEQVDNLINIYFNDQCNKKTRAKIYAYISICGLLWSNWCEYKKILGVELGKYPLFQYRFAKDYYIYSLKEMNF